MIDKMFITRKLSKILIKIQCENFLSSMMVDFFYEKSKKLNETIGFDNCIKLLDKYIDNFDNNLNNFKMLDNYHSIYSKYDYKTKTIEYNLTDDYRKYKLSKLEANDRKKIIIQEFRIMIYKEFEKIININSLNGIVTSNGFYVRDKNGRYPEYAGKYSDIFDIFSEVEICKMLNINRRIKFYIDNNKEYFVYMNHLSLRNSEVLKYVEVWRKVLNNQNAYTLAVNNPKMYSEKMINEFNYKYNSVVFNTKYKFMFKNKDVFSLIENYIFRIKNKIDSENNLKYHKDLSKIFEIINAKAEIPSISEYLLHGNDSM